MLTAALVKLCTRKCFNIMNTKNNNVDDCITPENLLAVDLTCFVNVKQSRNLFITCGQSQIAAPHAKLR